MMPWGGNRVFRVALLLDTRSNFDREIAAGVGGYAKCSKRPWVLHLEDVVGNGPAIIPRTGVDGIIANFDVPGVADVVSTAGVPAVAIGSSRGADGDYPQGIPYVATDDHAAMRLAVDHIRSVGISNVCLFGLRDLSRLGWARMREKAFMEMTGTFSSGQVFHGDLQSNTLQTAGQETVQNWLVKQRRPFGVVAVNDACARLIVNVCLSAGISVPDEVAVVGIDDDPLVHAITNLPMSSVRFNASEMGRTAARLLGSRLEGLPPDSGPVLVPPVEVSIAVSSQYQGGHASVLMHARRYIRDFAGQGIKTEQVADHVGVARSTLDAYFRREFGHTVHDEILATRLSMAKQMLCEGEQNAGRIAEQCGFNTLQYMHAVFKRELGCTPREYRQNRRLTDRMQ